MRSGRAFTDALGWAGFHGCAGLGGLSRMRWAGRAFTDALGWAGFRALSISTATRCSSGIVDGCVQTQPNPTQNTSFRRCAAAQRKAAVLLIGTTKDADVIDRLTKGAAQHGGRKWPGVSTTEYSEYPVHRLTKGAAQNGATRIAFRTDACAALRWTAL